MPSRARWSTSRPGPSLTAEADRRRFPCAAPGPPEAPTGAIDSGGETPGSGAREVGGRNARDESIGPVASRRWELVVCDAPEHGDRPTRLDPGDPLDDEIGTESFERDIGLNRQGHPWITPDVTEF